mmetsp:Transcript_36495/g.114396  ORF Transcript_36495/g.114396 Transcript_36495/m.114396 type:complete len:285 (+) Transcript_36495:70-924(+)
MLPLFAISRLQGLFFFFFFFFFVNQFCCAHYDVDVPATTLAQRVLRRGLALHQHNLVPVPAAHRRDGLGEVDPDRRPLALARREQLPHDLAPRARRRTGGGRSGFAAARPRGVANPRRRIAAAPGCTFCFRGTGRDWRCCGRCGPRGLCKLRGRREGAVVALGRRGLLEHGLFPLPEGVDDGVVVLEVEDERRVAREEGRAQLRPGVVHLLGDHGRVQAHLHLARLAQLAAAHEERRRYGGALRAEAVVEVPHGAQDAPVPDGRGGRLGRVRQLDDAGAFLQDL